MLVYDSFRQELLANKASELCRDYILRPEQDLADLVLTEPGPWMLKYLLRLLFTPKGKKKVPFFLDRVS